MTLKELLNEQGRKFDETFGALKFNQDFGSGLSDGRMAGCDDCETNQTLRKEHRDFLRQSNIETVKWVIKLATELEKEKWETGRPNGLIDLIFELNKSIE